VQTAAQSSSSTSGSLPFTGADVEELTAIGVGALVVGGVLVRRSRNRRRIQA
jgi:LPXTG-motif cell wall-anchored protein